VHRCIVTRRAPGVTGSRQPTASTSELPRSTSTNCAGNCSGLSCRPQHSSSSLTSTPARQRSVAAYLDVYPGSSTLRRLPPLSRWPPAVPVRSMTLTTIRAVQSAAAWTAVPPSAAAASVRRHLRPSTVHTYFSAILLTVISRSYCYTL